MSEAGPKAGAKPAKAMPRASEAASGWPSVRAFLRAHANLLTRDAELMTELGLKVGGPNVLEFGPAALARQVEISRREAGARQEMEETARANFAAQAQCHAAVLDLLEARSNADLARRFQDTAHKRFGCLAGVLAVESRAPMGWRTLDAGAVDALLGETGCARLGPLPKGMNGLFGETAEPIRSAALIRLTIWRPARAGFLALGSADPGAFAPHMASDLLAFLGGVVECTAERWLG